MPKSNLLTEKMLELMRKLSLVPLVDDSGQSNSARKSLSEDRRVNQIACLGPERKVVCPAEHKDIDAEKNYHRAEPEKYRFATETGKQFKVTFSDSELDYYESLERSKIKNR